MVKRALWTILAMVMLLSPGCLSSTVDQVNDNIWEMPDEDQWPQLNLGERIRTTPTLDVYDDCTVLEQDLRESLWEQTLVEIDQNSYWQWASPNIWFGGGEMVDDMVAESAMDGDVSSAQTGSAPSSSGSEDRSGTYSETNNQEQGVDEADFLKFDGFHFYMINNNHLVIVGVPEHGQVELVSDLQLEGTPMQMMKDGDSLIIISSMNAWNVDDDDPMRALMVTDDGSWRSSSLVKFTVIDMTNRSDPQVGRELFIEGNYETARMVNSTVRSVSHMWSYIPGISTYPDLPSTYWEMGEDWESRMEMWNNSVEALLDSNRIVIDTLTLDDFAPKVHERLSDGSIVTHSSASSDCSEFSGAIDSVGRGFTSIMTLDLLSESYSHEVDHIASSWVEVYSSGDMLVMAEPANDWWWYWRNDGFSDETNIHAFDISTTGETTYIGSGRVPGSVQDQFSMSEYEGDIRVASTTDSWGRWWLTDDGDWEVIEPVNHVTVLRDDGAGELDDVGYLGGIAEGERIWSARFVGDKGYLVTFRNMDPLWTIDLSDPENPTILGELEVPGVSTYIHPLSNGDLLTIGMPGGEDGLGLDWSHTQISMFNLSDLTMPSLADAQQLTPGYLDDDCTSIRYCGWSWSWSEATYEHKAFTYWEPAGLLAVPLSTYRYTYDEIIIDGRKYTHYGYEYVSKLVLIDVDMENRTLSIHGEIDHSEFYNEDGLGGWWGGDTSVRRSVFMGEYVYAFSGAGVSVTSFADMNTTATLELPGFDQPEPYGYYEDDVASSSSGGEEPASDPEEEPKEG
ncbi:MAG: beta-propeller domain-containing protein [Candidatus Thalassarchaeaceae archaeon]|nr:beta-propeller domain-containing protein [Candidatus Thalassarchaeaceae archaeon]